MNYKTYRVQGTNPNTGRKKTITIDVRDGRDARWEVLNLGELVEPLNFELIPFREPSEAQLKYANNLKIRIPKGACLEEVSDLISGVVDGYVKPSKELLKFAESRGVGHSEYISEERLLDKISSKMGPAERLAFYCFRVFQNMAGRKGKGHEFETSQHRPVFYAFARDNLQNERFSLSEIKVSEAYVTAAEYISFAIGIPMPELYYVVIKESKKTGNRALEVLTYAQAKEKGYHKDEHQDETASSFIEVHGFSNFSETLDYIVEEKAPEYDSFYDEPEITKQKVRNKYADMLLNLR